MAWSVQGEYIQTRWAKDVTLENVLPEYPRPQLRRDDWVNLNGLWDYAILPKTEETCETYQGEILVPFGVESPLSGVMKPLTETEYLWYRRSFTVPEGWSGKRILLHFGAVDWQAEVFVNGLSAGGHTGGYTPFSLDITDLLLPGGDNELVVRVYDPTEKGWGNRGKQVQDLHGFWYTATSGIWQTVWLEPVSETYIKRVKITPDIDQSCFRFEFFVENPAENMAFTASVSDGFTEVASGTSSDASFSVTVPDLKLWSPETPFLYDLTLSVSANGETADTAGSYAGMRKFHIANDKNGTPRIFLNNKPHFQNGLLDQGFWPDGIYTAPSDEALIYDIKAMKDLGFNMLRKHIKVEPARWYYHCDRLGMLVWQDMVSGGEELEVFWAGVLPNGHIHVKDKNYKRFHRDEPEWRAQFEEEMYEMIDAFYHFTSICCWVPFNEGWGQFDAKRIGDEVKAYDPTRLVDHASGWHDQGGVDFKSAHIYILPLAMQWKGRRKRPYAITEYGGYSHIVRGSTWDESKSFGYRMFDTKEVLTEKYTKLMRKQLLPLLKKGLCAAIYTQVSDVENEVNGLLTYDREHVKPDADTVLRINQEIDAEYGKLGIE